MARTAIIGAGVIGLTLGHQLARRGDEVVIVDQRRPGAGASIGNAGWVTPSLSVPVAAPGLVWTALKWMADPNSPLYIKPRLDPNFIRWLLSFMWHCRQEDFEASSQALLDLSRGTNEAFDELLEQGVSFEMSEAGLMMLAFDEDLLDHHLEMSPDLSTIGYMKLRRLSRAETHEMEPALSDEVAGSIYAQDDRHVHPASFVDGLVRALLEAGVEIKSETRVDSFDRSGRNVGALQTNQGRIEADRFVIAAGAWTGKLAKKAGFYLPIEAGKGYSITIDNPSVKLKYPLDLLDVRAAVTPFGDQLRFAGTMELSGINLKYRKNRVEAIWRNAHRYLRERVTGDRMRSWVGMRPMTPDGVPVLGRMPGSDNLYVATGHQMLGVTLAATTALAMAKLMNGEDPGFNLAPFDPLRFA